MNENQENANGVNNQPNVNVNPNETLQQSEVSIQQPVVQNHVVETKNDTDIVIGKIKPESESSPIAALIIFILLGSLIVFLPTISDYIDEFRAGETPVVNGGTTNNGNSGGNTTEPEEEIVVLGDATSITLGNFTINSFKFETIDNVEYFSYMMTRSNINVSFNDNLFIELYNETGTLLSRMRILPSETSGTSLNLKSIVPLGTMNSATKILITAKNEDEYPSINLEEDINGNQELVCTSSDTTLTYVFKSNKLVSLEERVNVFKGDDEVSYLNRLNEDQKSSLELNTIDGVSSSIISNISGHTLLNNMILSEVDFSLLSGYNYFEASTDARVVNFEMETIGFICN